MALILVFGFHGNIVEVIQETFPKRALVGKVIFTKTMRFKPDFITKLKDTFIDVKFV